VPVHGKVISVNVGGVRRFEYNGRPAASAIWKSPVEGRVARFGRAGRYAIVCGTQLEADSKRGRP
jgi:hypothetical protein